MVRRRTVFDFAAPERCYPVRVLLSWTPWEPSWVEAVFEPKGTCWMFPRSLLLASLTTPGGVINGDVCLIPHPTDPTVLDLELTGVQTGTREVRSVTLHVYRSVLAVFLAEVTVCEIELWMSELELDA